MRYSVTDLGTLGGVGSLAIGIDASGQVVGSAGTGGNDWHAFLYDGSTMIDLGTLGGQIVRPAASTLDGQVVGGSDLTDEVTSRAFLYGSGTMTDLGRLWAASNIALDEVSITVDR